MANGNSNFSNLTPGEGMVTIVPGLRGQVEGNREARLPFTQIQTVEFVASLRR